MDWTPEETYTRIGLCLQPGATISSSCACGETFTILADDSILVGGAKSLATNIYNVSFAGNFIGVTGIRLEAIKDVSLLNEARVTQVTAKLHSERNRAQRNAAPPKPA